MYFSLAIALLMIGTAVPSGADQWSFFHAETVVKYGCTVEEITHEIFGANSERLENRWQAEAYAERTGEPRWQMTVGEFPVEPKRPEKGRHQAEAACSKWMDEATKQVRAVKNTIKGDR